MDHEDNDIQVPMSGEDEPQGDSPQEHPADELSIPETPEELGDNPDDLKSLIHERDETITQLRERNEELQQKLAERQKTVNALTSRLEQAAEQLDRLHRSGADRGGKLLSGIPAEVIDEQRQLINDLKAAIQNWEDAQSTSAMGRFEAQLSELREMLAEQLHLKKKIDQGDTTTLLGRTTNPSGGETQEQTGKSSWDEMKARLLGDQTDSSPQATSDIMVPDAETSPSAASLEDEQSSLSDDFQVAIDERPSPVENLDEADANILRTAVRQRDVYIDHLLEVIDTLKEQTGSKALEESRERQMELEEKLRKSEIEMSMERAKLAREASRLKQMESEIKHPPNQDSQQEENSEEDSGNRWVKFLGSK